MNGPLLLHDALRNNIVVKAGSIVSSAFHSLDKVHVKSDIVVACQAVWGMSTHIVNCGLV